MAEGLLAIPGIKSLPPSVREQVSDTLGVPLKPPNWLPIAWSIAIIVFAMSSFIGVQKGIQFRIPNYTVQDLVPEGMQVPGTPSEKVLLQRASMILRSQGLPKQEAQEIFQTALVPLLTGQDPCKKLEDISVSERYNALSQAVNNLDIEIPLGSLPY